METVFFIAAGLLGFYMGFKPCLRYWHYRSMHNRPAFLRHTEGARFVDLLMWLVLIAGSFLMVNSCRWGLRVGVAIVAGVLLFDFLIRMALRENEIRKTRKRSPHLSYREAKAHVRQKVRSLLSP